jgi:hypothetical protein
MKAICDWHRRYETMTPMDYKVCGKARQEKARWERKKKHNVKPFQNIPR